MLKAIYLPSAMMVESLPVFKFNGEDFVSDNEGEPEYSLDVVINDNDWVVFIESPSGMVYQIKETTNPELDVLSNVINYDGGE